MHPASEGVCLRQWRVAIVPVRQMHRQRAGRSKLPVIASTEYSSRARVMGRNHAPRTTTTTAQVASVD